MAITAREETLREFIHDDRPFKVPRYQRAYAWEDEHMADFIFDLERTGDAMEGSNPITHFFGAVVSVRADPPEDQFLEVIDGQQRLTSISLAFRALERELRVVGKEAEDDGDQDLADEANAHANLLRESYLTYDVIEGPKMIPRPRLTLSEVDEEFFQELMERDELRPSPNKFERDSHERMYKAALRLRGSEGKGGPEGLIMPTRYDADGETRSSADVRLERLLKIQKALAEKCSIVHIQTTSKPEANRLFVTLNARGKGLADADLLRTQTLSQTEQDQALHEKVAGYWDVMLDEDGKYIHDFMKHYYSSLTGKNAPTNKIWQLYVNESLEDGTAPLKDQSAKEVCSFVKKMHDEEQIYKLLTDGDWPFKSSPHKVPKWDIAQLGHVVRSNGLKHTAAFPLLLAGAQLSEKDFSKLVQLVGRFAFRYKNVCSGNISRPQKLYYQHARAIRNGSFGFDALQTALQEEIDQKASDDIFKVALKTTLVYSENAANGNIKFFLGTINDYWAGLNTPGAALKPQKDAVADWAQIDIEHIYPQRPDPALLGRNRKMQERCHDFENLTLWWMSDNRQAGVQNFKVKKQSYANSSFAITQDLASLADWGVQEMNDRHSRLVDFALRVFVMNP